MSIILGFSLAIPKAMSLDHLLMRNENASLINLRGQNRKLGVKIYNFGWSRKNLDITLIEMRISTTYHRSLFLEQIEEFLLSYY